MLYVHYIWGYLQTPTQAALSHIYVIKKKKKIAGTPKRLKYLIL